MTILQWKISIHFSLLNSLMLAKYFDKIYAGARNLANMVIQELNVCQSFLAKTNFASQNFIDLSIITKN